MGEFTPGPWKAKFTPGPWAINNRPSQRPGYTQWDIYYTEDEECVVDGVYEEADAYLISAAPELYEALKKARSVLCIEGAGSYTLGEIDKALAKAEGKEA